MKLPSILKKLFGSAPAQEVIKVVVSDTQKVVAVLKTLPLATVVADDIRTIANDSLSGQQKFDIVLSKTLPALKELMAGKGLDVVVGDIEDIAREFVQAVFNDIMSTRAGVMAKAILALFGIA